MLPNKWWVRITVSTRDSQSRNRSSILLPTTSERLTIDRQPFLSAVGCRFSLLAECAVDGQASGICGSRSGSGSGSGF